MDAIVDQSATDTRLPAALTRHAGYLGVRFGHDAQRRFETAMAELDLRPAGYDFLSAVAEFGPLPQKEVARLLGVDPTRIVAMTDGLQKRGIVSRTVDPADRRRNLIALTPSGEDFVRRADQIAARVEGELLETLSEPERSTLRALLRQALRLGPS